MLRELFDRVVGRLESRFIHEDRLFTRRVEGGQEYFREHPSRIKGVLATRNTSGYPLVLSSIDSLIRFCLELAPRAFDDARPRIVISPKNQEIEATWNVSDEVDLEDFDKRVNCVSMMLQFPYTFKANQFLTFPDFLEWLEDCGDRFVNREEYEAVRAAIKRLRFVDLKSCEWRDRGSHLVVETTQVKNVEMENAVLPTRFSVMFPTGTHEIECRHDFRLKVDPKSEHIILSLHNYDEIITEFMRLASEKIFQALDGHVAVLDGAR